MSLVLGGGVSVRIQGHGVFSIKPSASAKCCITLWHLFKFRHCNEWDLNGNSRSRKNYLFFSTLMIGKGRTLIFIHQKKNIQNRRLEWFCRLDDSPTRLLIHFFGRSIYKLAKWTLKSNGHKSTGAIIISCRQHSWIGEGAHGNAWMTSDDTSPCCKRSTVLSFNYGTQVSEVSGLEVKGVRGWQKCNTGSPQISIDH